MLEKLFFLVSLHEIRHNGWYSTAGGFTLGLVIAAAIALLAVLLFYYVWGSRRSLVTFHYLMTGVVSLVVTLLTNFFVSKYMITEYAKTSGLAEVNPGILGQLSSGTIDMWLFSVNVALLGAVFYFVLSLLLKRWSKCYNIPFGRTKKQRKER